MAGEGGRRYEQALCRKMQRAGVVSQSFTPAASDSNDPDIIFYANDGNPYNLEVKNASTLLDFGQSVIHHNGTSWKLSGTNSVMVELLEGLGVEKIVNANWGVPNKRKRKSVTKEEAIQDIINFPDINAPASVDNVIRYYNGKGTYYIQIQNLGLYYMGSNPAGIPSVENGYPGGIKQLSGTYKVRLRRKPSGSTREDPDLTAALLDTGRKANLPDPLGSYGFTTAFQAETLPTASNINLDNILQW